MTPEQIALVQSSFAKVIAISDQTVALFYGRLFELDPAIKPLFKSDLTEQGRKLMQMISVAVNNLDNVEAIMPAVKDLAVRHVGYGVTAAHYDTVGAALLWTLEKGLGSAWTPEVQAAWTETYGLLAQVMKAAAYSA